MLPSILAKQLQNGIGDYIDTTFPMTNGPFKGSVRRMIDQNDSVYHEPYIAVRLPFRVADEMPADFEAIHPKYLPYVHQQKAFDRLIGDDGRSTLVATGTGSGKTECFIYPILEYCYKHRGDRGIKALIIYPMNALASDQARRIAELIYGSNELRGNVTVGMYVGGKESNASRVMSEHGVITDHETLLNSPPDILMTNYKMLDYLLIRPKDTHLWSDNDSETLKYIAVDELHTFDGAQGTDLACLLRRLKRRLGIYDGYLCCVGTSATMGSGESKDSIIQYATDIFGEPFEQDAVITEDRLSADEYFNGIEATEFSLPDNEQCLELEHLSMEDDQSEYLQKDVQFWFPNFSEDVLVDAGRIELGNMLLKHSFLQSVLHLTGGQYYQATAIVDELMSHYPELRDVQDPTIVINSLFALVSHARTGAPGELRPFLDVQVQLWMRELRRLLAKVSADDITYDIAHDLNSQQSKQYLPVVNCRDCGITGWASILNERQNATMTNLDAFYNRYFKADDRIIMMFPDDTGNVPSGMIQGKLCPECMQFSIDLGDEGTNTCQNCGVEQINVIVPERIKLTPGKHKQYVCPCCGSQRGMSLIGVRSATEISASISQLFASKFNDDKKTLAFSDNVQDAAHRAGFFNARTWRFGLRTAIQQYSANGGAGQSLKEFQDGFVDYWHEKMDDETFVSFFIAPNMTWMHAYENMIEERKLGNSDRVRTMMKWVEYRLKYEIMLEFGVAGKIGRTLEKSGCAVLSFNPEDISSIARVVEERTKNELAILTKKESSVFQRMVVGYLHRMRISGAFADEVFDEYTTSGKSWMISNDRNYWLPGRQSGRNTPRFIATRQGAGSHSREWDHTGTAKYEDWIIDCADELFVNQGDFRTIGQYILDEAVKREVLTIVPSAPEFKIYAINKEKVYVSSDVVQMRCNSCGTIYAVSKEDEIFWQEAPCMRASCGGHIHTDDTIDIGYYGRLYKNGHLSRINAKEHTGLLERDDREDLETDFKRGKDTQAIWDPNVLSCTPTLEMGIDIGDLSTVILCSMPPAQSQFLQRAGRAGRKDGNALTLAIANAKPHDLFFYSDPLDMIAGEVVPPKVFLKASAVLERQFIAFCMDSWIRNGVSDKAIPDKVGKILNRLEERPEDMFPFNFINYVQSKLQVHLNSFTQMFAGSWGDANEAKIVKEELQDFARGKDDEESPLVVKILDSFESLRKQRVALKDSVKNLKDMIKELEDKPKDSSYEEEIQDLKKERNALQNVIKEIDKKNIYNFLSDEGLLPNYAFPEAGIILRAMLYRKEEEGAETGKRRYEKMVYEYNRSASSAISEFAPRNDFYVDGRKLTIDQVDLTTAQSAPWRLCPNCSHAQIEETGKNVADCPQCGSPLWADAGQVRNMLKVQMVYSNADYVKSMISDDSDSRSNIFYCKQLLVDVDEDHDIASAYKMDNEDFPFGFEFVSKATLREINFGESDTVGEKLSVSGVEDIRKGFRICKYCGKIQPDEGKPQHTFACKTRKMTAVMQEDSFEECLFLYREFSTEILRLLIPATTLDSSMVKTESFVAAFMLGMKEYFGNVDHLRATVSEVPVSDADYRKQYLVIYDSVPGGTGYLKQLMNEKDALIDVFDRALDVLENCSCKDDPQKDGCYHCLYAYRQSQKIGNVSRAAAIHMLKSILSGKDNIEKIKKINDIPVNPLFDSELEQRFMEAIRQKVGTANVKDTIRNGKHSYYLTIDDCSWEVEPQVSLGPSEGVAINSKPDFVFWPVNAPGRMPVAVFTDGFLYHKDIVTDDTLKREAIRRSGNYRVWSLSYKDVQSVFSPQGDYASASLSPDTMPSGKIHKNTIKGFDAEGINPANTSAFNLLIDYISLADSEDLFKKHALAYTTSLLDVSLIKSNTAFSGWKSMIDEVADQTHFTEMDVIFPGTMFGIWGPRSSSSHLTIYAGALLERIKNKEPIAVCAILEDDIDRRTDKYEAEWNGFWNFYNVMQFADEFIGVSSTGISNMDYVALPTISDDYVSHTDEGAISSWDNIKSLLFDDDSKVFVDIISDILSGADIPNEDDIGYEVEGENGEVIATIEIAWPSRKIGFMTADQMEDKEAVEAVGWKILSVMDAAGIADFFGGEQ